MITSIYLLLFLVSAASAQSTERFTFFNPNNFSTDATFSSTACCQSSINCFSQYHAGPFTGDGRFYKNITGLNPHWRVNIYYGVLLLDSNNSGYVTFYADGRSYSQTTFYNAYYYGSDNCRYTGYNDYRSTYSYTIYHTNSHLLVEWVASGTYYMNQAWGINYFELTVYRCLQNCSRCTEQYRCLECEPGFYLWKNDTIDICKPCPNYPYNCTLDQTTGILSLSVEFNSIGSISSTVTNWTSMPSGYFVCCTTCGSHRISSLIPSTRNITKTWENLPIHCEVNFTMNIFSVDTWSDDYVFLELPDEGQIATITFNSEDETRTENICGNSTIPDEIRELSARFPHTSSSLKARIGTNVTSLGKMYLNNLTLSIALCYDANCLACSSPFVCTQCIPYYYPHPTRSDYQKCKQCPGGARKCEVSNKLYL